MWWLLVDALATHRIHDLRKVGEHTEWSGHDDGYLFMCFQCVFQIIVNVSRVLAELQLDVKLCGDLAFRARQFIQCLVNPLTYPESEGAIGGDGRFNVRRSRRYNILSKGPCNCMPIILQNCTCSWCQVIFQR